MKGKQVVKGELFINQGTNMRFLQLLKAKFCFGLTASKDHPRCFK